MERPLTCLDNRHQDRVMVFKVTMIGSTTMLTREWIPKSQQQLDFHTARFVDRDIFMRFLGGGVGHKAARFPGPSEVESEVDGQDNENSTDCREAEPDGNDDEEQPSDQEDGGSEPLSDAEAS